jgi:hypothetical protein
VFRLVKAWSATVDMAFFEPYKLFVNATLLKGGELALSELGR